MLAVVVMLLWSWEWSEGEKSQLLAEWQLSDTNVWRGKKDINKKNNFNGDDGNKCKTAQEKSMQAIGEEFELMHEIRTCPFTALFNEFQWFLRVFSRGKVSRAIDAFGFLMEGNGHQWLHSPTGWVWHLWIKRPVPISNIVRLFQWTPNDQSLSNRRQRCSRLFQVAILCQF